MSAILYLPISNPVKKVCYAKGIPWWAEHAGGNPHRAWPASSPAHADPLRQGRGPTRVGPGVWGSVGVHGAKVDRPTSAYFLDCFQP
ncbi:MAG: hypothetical protein ACE5IY_23620 [bacterium]